MSMTTKEIFDKMVNHLLTQGRQASSDSGMCKYRFTLNNHQTISCAIGGIILDEFYSEDLEGARISNSEYGADVVTAVEKSVGRAITEEEVGLFQRMQIMHDGYYGVEDCGPWVEYVSEKSSKIWNDWVKGTILSANP